MRNEELKVHVGNNTLSCPYGTVAGTLVERFGIAEDAVIALRVNNEICPLETRLEVNSTLEPVLLNTPEGAAIYRRSLAFLLAIAARTCFPGQSLAIGHSLGNSYYYTFNSGNTPAQQDIESLQKEMESLVQKNLPITFKYLAYEEALAVFTKNRQTDTVLLLDQRSTSRIRVNECNNYLDMYVEPLAPHTGLLSIFKLLPYQEGFLLCFPAVGSTSIEPFTDIPKLFDVYHEYKQWGRIVGVRVVGELNSLTTNRTINDYIRIAETHQARKMAKIAEHIYEQRDKVKMVLLAGPSSSGKTTSAKRLSIELMVMGIKPIAISLDDYYVGKDKTPKDEKGEPDYECLEALDVPFLNEQLQALYRGEEITLPVYDFKTSSRKEGGGRKIRLDNNTILIVEGIHALNDALTYSIMRDTKFKLYVSALTQLNLDDHNRIPTSDNRLLRRMVRDYQFRAKDAAGTIKMWSNVQIGERKYIFPFQNTADTMFNSALDYELSVLKYYADPLLRAVKPSQREYAEASRLLSFLGNFAPIPPQYVPGASILREFIGDSEFKY
ncbi:MAG: nucleoside kinase [Treponema sp.]|nr:nucleoside kinase [Treponema sp.]